MICKEEDEESKTRGKMMTETQPKDCFYGSVESVSTFLLGNVRGT